MILLYQKRSKPDHDEAALIESFDRAQLLSGGIGLRNAAFWRGEIEEGVTLVYSDDARIRKAYQGAGSEAFGVPKPKIETPMPKPRDTKPTTTRTTKPKATTTRTRKPKS